MIPDGGQAIDDCDFIQYHPGIKYFFRPILRKLKKLYTKSSKAAFCRLFSDGSSLESVVVMAVPPPAPTQSIDLISDHT